jgi:hypothetical protein
MSRRGVLSLAALAILVPVLISYALRCHALTAPLSGRQAFRQTQMAITVWCFVEEGIDPWRYQTPIFGPPWQTPFEFPLPQIAAALLVKAGIANIDLACRLTNLLFFTLSVPFVHLLARWFFRSAVPAACVTAAYLCDPLTIFWSQTAMIDYCSVFFALGYLYFFARYLGRGGVAMLLTAVLFGAVGAVVKITTLAVVAVPLTWLAVRKLRQEVRAAGAVLAGPVVRTALACGVAAIVPLAAGQAWVAHTDRIKAASPATACMTSERLRTWNYGTVAERTNPMNWFRVAARLEFPFLVTVGLAWAATRLRPRPRGFAWSMAIGGALAVVLFLNLYRRHDYYLMACTPAIAVAAGLGLFVICFRIVRRPMTQWCLLGTLLLLMVGKGAAQFVQDEKYIRSGLPYGRPFDPVTVGAYLQSVTAPDERVVIEGVSFSPELLYYGRRKGLMWDPLPAGEWTDAERIAVADLLHRDKFTIALAPGGKPETLRCWKRHQLLGVVEGFHVYRVSDDEPRSP